MWLLGSDQHRYPTRCNYTCSDILSMMVVVRLSRSVYKTMNDELISKLYSKSQTLANIDCKHLGIKRTQISTCEPASRPPSELLLLIGMPWSMRCTHGQTRMFTHCPKWEEKKPEKKSAAWVCVCVCVLGNWQTSMYYEARVLVQLCN